MAGEIRNGYEQADWQKHYDENDLAWDLGEVANPFVRLWEDNALQPGSLIVPGCGQGHEVIYFAERGFQVTGVDFASGAVGLLQKNLKSRNLNGKILHQNFFELDETHNQTYDSMLEQTFFCAIHKDQRSAYVDTVSRILKPGGLLFGLFYETGEEGGPPFNTTETDIQNYFAEAFDIERLEKCSFSSEKRKDKEWLTILRKKPESQTG
jgi:cyclopropane fatty-acyl-phospholipid synthase-like methyltransferase